MKIIKDYTARYPEKIRYFTHPDHVNRGLIQTYKLALQQVKGDYIAFLESDDIWLKDSLKKKLDVLKEHRKVALVYTDVELFGDLKNRIDKMENTLHVRVSKQFKNEPFFTSELLKRNIIPTFSAVMVKKEAFDDIDFAIPQEYTAWTDWWFWTQISMKGWLFCIDDRKTRWRIHQMSNNYQHDICVYDRKKHTQLFLEALRECISVCVRKSLRDTPIAKMLEMFIKENWNLGKQNELRRLRNRLDDIEKSLGWQIILSLRRSRFFNGPARRLLSICLKKRNVKGIILDFKTVLAVKLSMMRRGIREMLKKIQKMYYIYLFYKNA